MAHGKDDAGQRNEVEMNSLGNRKGSVLGCAPGLGNSSAAEAGACLEQKGLKANKALRVLKMMGEKESGQVKEGTDLAIPLTGLHPVPQ